MTHDDAFLQSIIETPDDDVPRSIYADWLEDHGQAERAEFIRIQCEISKLADGSLRRAELTAREAHLLEAHGKEWAGESRVEETNPSYLGGTVRLRHGSFVRGFVEELSIEIIDLVTHADLLFSRAPIRHLKIEDTISLGEIRLLEMSPYLGRIESICLNFGISFFYDEVLAALAASPLVCRRLKALSAMECRLSVGTLESFFASPHLLRLQDFRFYNCGIEGLPGIRPLVDSPNLGALTSLSLTMNPLGDEAVQALAASPNCSRLTYLDLMGCGFGNAGAVALGRSPHLACSRHLTLAHNEIGNAGAAALANSPYLAGLEYLALDNNRIRDGGAEALATSPYLGRLESLILWDNEIGPAGANILSTRFGDRVSLVR